VARHPGDVALRLGLAQALRGAGRLEDADETLQEGLRRNWKEPRLFAELAALRQEAGDFEEALQYARSALSLRPNEVGFLEVLIDALLSLGRAGEAMPVIESLRRQSPLNQWYVAMEATAARLLGDARYAAWYDYGRLVRSFDLAPPPGWSSIEAFHEELIPVLTARHQFQAEPLDQSLRSGTQTPRSLLGDPDPRIQAFLRALAAPIAEYRQAIGFAADHPFGSRNRGPAKFAGCWSVLLRQGGYHVNHVHTEGWISSAYYVEVPPEVADEDARSGWLKFGEPRFRVPGAGPEKFVQPRAGRLVLFPSYLWHGTLPTVSDARRLTVAFDVVPRPRG
jgi:tetratricopeptide (TPR) repeat protein